MEQKVKCILNPLIYQQIKDFMSVYCHQDDKMFEKTMQLIAIEIASIARDLHEKDLN
jgi:hypothetical protein